MKVEVQKLSNALNAVKPAVSKRSILEQMTHFIFTEDAVTAFDNQICISYPIETGLRCTVKADSMLKFVPRIDSEKIDLSIKDGNLIGKAQGVEAELPVLVDDEIYKLVSEVQKQRGKTKWLPIPDKLLEGMSYCMFAAGKDASREYLTCVAVKGKDIIAGDGSRFGWAQLEETTRKNFMIRATSVNEITRFGGFTHYCLSESWAHFKTRDKAVFHIRQDAGSYPIAQCKKQFESFEGADLELKETDRESIREAVETASVLSEEISIDKSVEISFEKNKIICKGETESGKVTRRRKITYEGEPFSFLINPLFLMQILDQDEPSSLSIADGKMELKSENFRHLIALKRKVE